MGRVDYNPLNRLRIGGNTMSTTEQEARSNCPLDLGHITHCYDCPRLGKDCDGKDDMEE